MSVVRESRRGLSELLRDRSAQRDGGREGAAPDWPRVIEETDAKLHPWIAHRLSVLGRSSDVPPASRDILTASQRLFTMRMLRAKTAFQHIDDALRGAGVPFIALKGLALAHTVYPAAELRPMSDLDLWLADDDRPRARRSLVSAGWKVPLRHARSHDDPHASTWPLEHPRLEVMLELHSPPQSVDGDPAAARRGPWKRAVRADVFGRETLVLAPADALVHACLHAARKHRFDGGVLPMLDVALLVRRFGGEWDWAELRASHRERGTDPWIPLALETMAGVFPVEVPQAYLAAHRAEQAWPRLVGLAAEQVWASEVRHHAPGLDAHLLLRSGRARALARAVHARFVQPLRDGNASWSNRVLEVIHRLRDDLFERAPRYVAMWRRGALRRERTRARHELAVRRDELARLAGTIP